MPKVYIIGIDMEDGERRLFTKLSTFTKNLTEASAFLSKSAAEARLVQAQRIIDCAKIFEINVDDEDDAQKMVVENG